MHPSEKFPTRCGIFGECMSKVKREKLSKRKLSEVKNLLSKKGRDETGNFIIEGWKSIFEAHKSGIAIHSLIYDASRIHDDGVLNTLENITDEILTAAPKELESISDTVTNQGIIAVLPKLNYNESLQQSLIKSSVLIVVLDGISDPGNLGTMIRTADWFGVDAIVISEHSVDLYNPKVVRSTMGSIFHLPVIENIALPEFLALAKNHHCTMYSTELTDSVDIRDVVFAKKSVIIIGSESHGVSSEVSALTTMKIRIPSFGKAESLNASQACGIILSRVRL